MSNLSFEITDISPKLLSKINDAYLNDPEAQELDEQLETLETKIHLIQQKRERIFRQYIKLGRENKLPKLPKLSPPDPCMTSKGRSSPSMGYVNKK